MFLSCHLTYLLIPGPYFSDNLKLADITSVFKKKIPLHKVHYRPVSPLPSISGVFEKLVEKQIGGCKSNYLSPYLCGYR